jgi:hypothetical protein
MNQIVVPDKPSDETNDNHRGAYRSPRGESCSYRSDLTQSDEHRNEQGQKTN